MQVATKNQCLEDKNVPEDDFPNNEKDLKNRVDSLSQEIRIKKQKQIEDRLCYICQDLLQCPLQLCDEGHCVCAKCFAFQMQNDGLKINCYADGDEIPQVAIAWAYKNTCHLCKKDVDPRFPGSFFVCLIAENNDQPDNCCFCQAKMPLHLLAKHIIMCHHQFVPCCCCGQMMQIRFLDEHLKTSCSSIPCPRCTVKLSSQDFKAHIDLHKETTMWTQTFDSQIYLLNSALSGSPLDVETRVMANINDFRAIMFSLSSVTARLRHWINPNQVAVEDPNYSPSTP